MMKIAPDSARSDQQLNIPEIKLHLRGIAWKNLMSECLMKTEIFKVDESKNECSINNFDPNVVMDLRHKMIEGSWKAFPTPRGHVQSEAFKILREEYHDRLLRHKEGKLVEKEIVKLRQTLENHRLVIKKKLEEISEKARASPKRAKPTKCQAVRRMDGWLGSSAQMSVETEIGRWEIPGKPVKVSGTEEILEFVPSRKGSPMEEKEGGEKSEFWEEDGGKDEIMRRFLENEAKPSEQRFENDVKEGVNVKHEVEVSNVVNERNIGLALKKWKKSGEYENGSTGKKIERFLSRLKEKRVKEEKGTGVGIGRGMRRQVREKRAKDDETDEKLRKLMQEVKSSQRECQEKLQGARNNTEVDGKFLLRMEERRKDRMKRRREFEERKLRLEEEKEKAERQREEEKKQKDEEEKRKRLEELKEKRRAEKEKREEHAREREKLKVAVAHHKVYLMRGYGLRPWVKMMRMREEAEERAIRFFERRLKEGMLRKWAAGVREQTELKVRTAMAFHEGMLKRKYLATWMEFCDRSARQNQAAVDWYDLKVSEAAFRRWLQFTKAEQSEWRIKSEAAVKHHQRKLKIRSMEKLRDYPLVKRLERAKENRKWKWRQKVKEILPDYEPVNISDNDNFFRPTTDINHHAAQSTTASSPPAPPLFHESITQNFH